MYGCESWAIKKAGCRRIDAFELWCWRRVLKVPWTARKFNQEIGKEISPEYSLEGLMLKLKQSDGTNWLIGEDPDAGQDWRQEEKGMTEVKMVGWHHQLDGHKSEQTPGDSDGQGGLASRSSCGHEESDTTEWLNWAPLLHWELFVPLSPGVLALGLFAILMKISTQSYKLVRTLRLVLCGHFCAYFPYYKYYTKDFCSFI